MIVKLLIEHHLEFLILKGGCRGSSESTLVKVSNCWKSHALAQVLIDHRVLDCHPSHRDILLLFFLLVHWSGVFLLGGEYFARG